MILEVHYGCFPVKVAQLDMKALQETQQHTFNYMGLVT